MTNSNFNKMLEIMRGKCGQKISVKSADLNIITFNENWENWERIS